MANEGLIVPRQDQIKGKLKTRTPSNRGLYLGILILGLLIAGFFSWKLMQSNDVAPEHISREKIAIMIFENLTGDAAQDIIGTVASEWITAELERYGVRNIVSTNNIRTYLASHKDQTTPINPLSLTDARYIVEGNYFKKDSALIFKYKLTDTQSGENIKRFPDVTVPQDEAMQAIEIIAKRITGYWAQKDEVTLGYLEKEAPKLEAFREFYLAHDTWGIDFKESIKHLKNAINIDSSFLMPYLYLITSHMGAGYYDEADSIATKVINWGPESNEYYYWAAKFFRAQMAGSRKDLIHAFNQVSKAPPDDFDLNYNWGRINLQYLNDPESTIKIYEKMDLSKIDFAQFLTNNWMLIRYADAHVRLGEYEKALKIMEKIPKSVKTFRRDRFLALIAIRQNRLDDLQQLLEAIHHANYLDGSNGEIFEDVAREMVLVDHPAKDTIIAKMILWLEQKNQVEDQRNLGRLYHFNRQWSDARRIYESLLNSNQEDELWKGIYTSQIALIEANLGHQNKALALAQQLENHGLPYQFGIPEYMSARVHATIGNKDKAFRMLKKSIQKGKRIHIEQFDGDPDLKPLFGDERFVNLLQYKN